jgi:Ca2+-binding RTX toxin-like protein
LVFGKTTAINIESIVVTDGSDYSLTLNNATNAKNLVVDARALTGGNTLVLDGSQETTGTLLALGGAGGDKLIGGGGSDTLIGGAGGDTMNGAGVDTVTYASATSAIGVNALAPATGPATAMDAAERREVIARNSAISLAVMRSSTDEGGFGNDTLAAGAIPTTAGRRRQRHAGADGNLTAADRSTAARTRRPDARRQLRGGHVFQDGDQRRDHLLTDGNHTT